MNDIKGNGLVPIIAQALEVMEAKAKLPCVKRKGKLDAFKDVINTYLKQGVTNSAVIFSDLKKEGFTGGLTIVKNYISSNKDLVPAKRILVALKAVVVDGITHNQEKHSRWTVALPRLLIHWAKNTK